MPQENIHKAIAGGEQNNCLVNCIAHSLFSLPKEQLEQIARRDAFDNIMQIFKDYYGLSDKPTLPMLLAIHQRFRSPYDIEVIWGPVFRKYLLHHENTPESDIRMIYGDESIPDEVGAILANDLGASLLVNHEHNDLQGPIDYPIQDPEFEIILYHSARGDGHYDFVYPNDLNGEKAKKHNETLKESSIIYNENKGIHDKDERKKNIASLLKGTLQRFATNEQLKNNAIKSQENRKRGFRFDHATLTTPQFLNSNSTPSQPSTIEFKINNSANPQLSTEEEAVLTSRKSPNHLSHERTEEESANELYPNAFLERLSVLFDKKEWRHDLKGNNLDITHNTDKNRKVNMVRNAEKDEITFKCSSENVTDMLRCAMAYSETTASQNLTYELKVSSNEQAKAILNQMRDNKFNLDKLETVIINGQPLAADELKNLKAEIIKGVTSEPEPTARKGMKN